MLIKKESVARIYSGIYSYSGMIIIMSQTNRALSRSLGRPSTLIEKTKSYAKKYKHDKTENRDTYTTSFLSLYLGVSSICSISAS